MKGYDPTKDDISKQFLEYLIRWSVSDVALTLDQSEKDIKGWFKEQEKGDKELQVIDKRKHINNKNIQQHQSQQSKQPQNTNLSTFNHSNIQIVLKKNCFTQNDPFFIKRILSMTGMYYQWQRIYENITMSLYKEYQKRFVDGVGVGVDGDNESINNTTTPLSSFFFKNNQYNNNWQYRSQYCDEYYPAYIKVNRKDKKINKDLDVVADADSNTVIDSNYQIVLCLDLIKNKVQLKQNLDRELKILQKLYLFQSSSEAIATSSSTSTSTSTSSSLFTDKQLMQVLFEGCKAGYRNYNFQKETQKKLSKKCAKFLFFKRKNIQLPWDIKFRYASKLVDELIV